MCSNSLKHLSFFLHFMEYNTSRVEKFTYACLSFLSSFLLNLSELMFKIFPCDPKKNIAHMKCKLSSDITRYLLTVATIKSHTSEESSNPEKFLPQGVSSSSKLGCGRCLSYVEWRGMRVRDGLQIDGNCSPQPSRPEYQSSTLPPS